MPALYALTSRTIYVGTDGGGINVLKNGQRIATYTEESGHLSGNSVQTALCDQKGNLWFGIFNGGIMFYNTQAKTFQQILPEKESTQDVRSLFEDSNGTIWAGTSNGVFQIDRESKKILQHMNANAPDNLVRSVIKDKKGQIWVGSFGRGIFLYASNGKRLKDFNTYLNFPSNTINQILKTQRDIYGLLQEKALFNLKINLPGNIKYTSVMRDWPTLSFGPLKKMKAKISGLVLIKESVVLSEVKEISIITTSETIFQWQVLREEVAAKTKMELCTSDQLTDSVISLPVIFWKSDKAPKAINWENNSF